MRLNDIKPLLWTRAIKESITFYTDVLGFVLDEFNEEWGWASLHLDDIVIMVATPNEHMTFEQPTFTGSLYQYRRCRLLVAKTQRPGQIVLRHQQL